MSQPLIPKIVVLAEDSQEIGVLVSMKLHKAGFKVVWEKRGDLALEAIKKHRPSLVISDISMPGLTGLQLVEAIRADPAVSETPVLMLTASSIKDDILKSKSLGVVEYVLKPFRVEDLMNRIQKLMQRDA